MDFDIPDEGGKQPTGDPIVLSSDNDSSLTTSLPLSVIIKEFQNSQIPAVVISEDPGRFVCKYIYYKSLLHQQSKQSLLNSLFIHVPRDNVDLTVKIVKQVITSVCNACFQ